MGLGTQQSRGRLRTCLHYDDFTRTTSSSLGTATDGDTYTLTTGQWDTIGTVARGSVLYSTPSYAVHANSTVADADITVLWYTSNAAATVGLTFRYTDTNNNYQIRTTGSTLTLYKYVAGTGSAVGAAASITALAASTNYMLRIQCVQSTIKVKHWLASASEPATWTLVRTDTSLTSGLIGLMAASSRSQYNVYWDNLRIDSALPQQSSAMGRFRLAAGIASKVARGRMLLSASNSGQKWAAGRLRAAIQSTKNTTGRLHAAIRTSKQAMGRLRFLTRANLAGMGRAKLWLRVARVSAGRMQMRVRSSLLGMGRTIMRDGRTLLGAGRTRMRISTVQSGSGRSRLWDLTANPWKGWARVRVQAIARSSARFLFGVRTILMGKGRAALRGTSFPKGMGRARLGFLGRFSARGRVDFVIWMSKMTSGRVRVRMGSAATASSMAGYAQGVETDFPGYTIGGGTTNQTPTGRLYLQPEPAYGGALTFYGSGIASETLTNAGKLSQGQTGGSETSAITITTGTNIYAELFARGGSTTGTGSIPSTPTGKGWAYRFPVAGNFAAGNWSASLTISASGWGSNPANSGLTLRAFKYSGGSYSLLGTLFRTITTTAKTTYAFSATSFAAASFSAGDILYFDLWWLDNNLKINSDNPAVYQSNSPLLGVASDMQITTSTWSSSTTSANVHGSGRARFGGKGTVLSIARLLLRGQTRARSSGRMTLLGKSFPHTAGRALLRGKSALFAMARTRVSVLARRVGAGYTRVRIQGNQHSSGRASVGFTAQKRAAGRMRARIFTGLHAMGRVAVGSPGTIRHSMGRAYFSTYGLMRSVGRYRLSIITLRRASGRSRVRALIALRASGRIRSVIRSSFHASGRASLVRLGLIRAFMGSVRVRGSSALHSAARLVLQGPTNSRKGLGRARVRVSTFLHASGRLIFGTARTRLGSGRARLYGLSLWVGQARLSFGVRTLWHPRGRACLGVRTVAHVQGRSTLGVRQWGRTPTGRVRVRTAVMPGGVVGTGRMILRIPSGELHHTAQWVTRDGKVAWITCDGHVTWIGRDSMATWYVEESE